MSLADDPVRTGSDLVHRYFTAEGVEQHGPLYDVFASVEWEHRDAWTPDSPYHNAEILVPDTWSQNALNIVSKLYLAKASDYREKSIRQLIERVASKYAVEGANHGYFGLPSPCEPQGSVKDIADRISWLQALSLENPVRVFYDELCFILLHQLAAFNSPVWFNVGRHDSKQQVSACFILSVDDNTDSIINTSAREIRIFRGGSGSGFDISRLRGSQEALSTGGTASGPVSFMRMWDAGAGTFKSGGKNRRAAKLVKCDMDHPDIREFITCKVREEQRMRDLAAAGHDIGFSEEAERNLAEFTSFQNANNSVGVTDAFMRKATGDDADSFWPLTARVPSPGFESLGGRTVGDEDAVGLMQLVAEAAWDCADPGIQFMDTMNAMHTTPMIDGVRSPIRSTNPCGEYMSNDDTSCNLASLNVLKFVRFDRDTGDTDFAIAEFQQVVDVMTTAMDISICFAEFPDEVIAQNTRDLRQLGLGYSNMGAAIMAQGMAYDSDDGRGFAAGVTALLTGRSYRQSTKIAKLLGSFRYYEENSQAMLEVIGKHTASVGERPYSVNSFFPIWQAADSDWINASRLGSEHGFRNAQASVIAPAGTISFLMDCDTTGVEPDFSLVKHKTLAGGGSMTIVNQSVSKALLSLGYSELETARLNGVLLDEGVEMFLRELEHNEDRGVFDTAGDISPAGHIKMLAAVQPFVSGAISKTINMDESCTVQDIFDAYVLAWRSGVKDLAVYRNNSKARQVLAGKPKEEVQAILAGEDEKVISDEEFNAEMDRITEADLFERPKVTGWHRDEVPLKVADGDGGFVGPGAQEAVDYIVEQLKQYEVPVPPQIKVLEEEPSQLKVEPLDKDKLRATIMGEPVRHRMPRTREMICHKIHVRSALGEHEGYVMAGKQADGSIGELFIEGFGKHGSFTQNALSAWATDFSIALQYGVPMDVLVRKHAYVADETGGMIMPGDDDTPLVIRECKSIVDYIARWVVAEFGDEDLCEELGVMTQTIKDKKAAALEPKPRSNAEAAVDLARSKQAGIDLAVPSDLPGPPHAYTEPISYYEQPDGTYAPGPYTPPPLGERDNVQLEDLEPPRFVVTDFGSDEDPLPTATGILQPDGTFTDVRIGNELLGNGIIDPSKPKMAFHTRPWLEGLARAEKPKSNGHGRAVEMGPACQVCSTPMQRTGGCHTCPSCGATTGCG